MLDDVVTETIGEHLAWQRGDGDASALALEDVAKVLEVGIAAADCAVLELEGRDIGPTNNFVIRVHAARCPVGLRVFDLEGKSLSARLVSILCEACHEDEYDSTQVEKSQNIPKIACCSGAKGKVGGNAAYLDLEKVLRWTVDFFKGLLTGVWHCLHGEAT